MNNYDAQTKPFQAEHFQLKSCVLVFLSFQFQISLCLHSPKSGGYLIGNIFQSLQIVAQPEESSILEKLNRLFSLKKILKNPQFI